MEFVGKRGGGIILSYNIPSMKESGWATGDIAKRVPGMEFVGKRSPGTEFFGKRAQGMGFVGK